MTWMRGSLVRAALRRLRFVIASKLLKPSGSWWSSYVACYFRSYALERQWIDPTLPELLMMMGVTDER